MTKKIQKAVGKMQVLKNHSPICENVSNLLSHEMDVMSISKSGMMLEFEIKISRSDFKADAKKSKFKYLEMKIYKGFPNYFSYVCPKDLISIDEIPSYSGLYYYENGNIIEIKKPKFIHKEKHDKEMILTKACRLYSERHFLGCARLTYENNSIRERNK